MNMRKLLLRVLGGIVSFAATVSAGPTTINAPPVGERTQAELLSELYGGTFIGTGDRFTNGSFLVQIVSEVDGPFDGRNLSDSISGAIGDTDAPLMSNIFIDYAGNLYGDAADQYWLGVTFDGRIGLIGNFFKGGHSFSADPAENPGGKDRLLVYSVDPSFTLANPAYVSPRYYVLFWEDGDDDDFNDAVFSTGPAVVVPTVNTAVVPLPSAFLAGLVTTGVAGVGYTKRRWRRL